jgi:hypothetical protein
MISVPDIRASFNYHTILICANYKIKYLLQLVITPQ